MFTKLLKAYRWLIPYRDVLGVVLHWLGEKACRYGAYLEICFYVKLQILHLSWFTEQESGIDYSNESYHFDRKSVAVTDDR